MGSVAQGNALPESDLDIMVLCNENSSKTNFIDDIIDGILVECSFDTYESRLQKLLNNDIQVYRFLNNKITYDTNGELSELMKIALDKYRNFITKHEIKNQISHWLLSTKIKLLSAINSHDTIKQNFIVSTNSWKIIEAIWAVNDKPMPPQSSVLRFKNELLVVPYLDWFERLFSGDDESKSNSMIEIIEWVLPILEARTV